MKRLTKPQRELLAGICVTVPLYRRSCKTGDALVKSGLAEWWTQPTWGYRLLIPTDAGRRMNLEGQP